jgi:ubiquinone/menaquinone biosynthesis C-methylase UbiE
MGQLINLLKHYPASKRPIDGRAASMTDEHRAIASQFGESYFDGDRQTGYGGYHYHPRFWRKTAELLIEHYGLSQDSSVLDIGCAKGFLLYELKDLLPDISIKGVDISNYAIDHAKEEVKPFLSVGNAKSLPFDTNSFDLVIAINVLHSLDQDECIAGFQEITRVRKQFSFVVNDAWHTNEEKNRLMQWNLTGKTFMHVDDWEKFFAEIGYDGDYWWFIAE